MAILPRRRREETDGPISAQEIRQRWEKGSEDIAAQRRAYEVNSCFVAGEQNIWWDDRSNRPDVLPDWSPDRAAVVNNVVWPASRTLMAKLLRRPLVFEVPPKASGDSVVAGARKAEAVLGDTHREHNWEGLRRDHVWATWLGGSGLLAVDYDAQAGQALGQSEDGRPYGTGDTAEYALSIAEVATEPGSRDIERGRWWIRACALPPGEVAELYGLDEPPTADASAVMSPLQARMATGADKSSLCLVLTYYERPTRRSEGQVVVVVGEQVVDRGPWHFPFRDRLNVVVCRETPVSRRWAGDTVLSAAISPQRALNRAESSIDEHMDAAGNARLMVEDGSVDDEEWDDDPSSIVKVRAGTQRDPEYLSPPTMPAWWQQRPADLRSAIDDALGWHDISRGDAPAGAGAGVALSLLAEQDDTPLGAFSKELAEGWGRFASLVLEIDAAKVTETRAARIERPGQVPEVIEWTGKDLAGQTTAVVPADAVAPTSRAGQLQKGLLLLDKGVFGPPGDPATTRRFLDFVDLPGGADVEDAVDFHVAKAQRENYRMSLGEVRIPAPFDDHAAHIAEHNRDRCSEDYELATDEVRSLKDLHVETHETLAAEEMGRQMAKGAVSPALAAAAQAHEPPLAGEPVPAPVEPPTPGAPGAGYPVPPGTAGPAPTPPTEAPGPPGA